MIGSSVQESMELLRGRWRQLLFVAVLALGPAVAATSLIEVLDTRANAIINGSVAADSTWTEVVLTGEGGGSQVRLTVPVLLVLAWFVGLGVGLRVLAGPPMSVVWRGLGVARLTRWLALGAVLGALTLLSFAASVLVAGFVDGDTPLFGGLTALVCAYGLARVALALPAMLVDGYSLTGSLRRAISVTRGRAVLTGTALILLGVGTSVVLTLADPRSLPKGGSWVGDVVWTGVGSLVGFLALVLMFPIQVAMLHGVYRVAAASSAPATALQPAMPEAQATVPRGEPELTVTMEPPARGWDQEMSGPGRAGRLTVAGVVLIAVVAPAVGPAVLLANPRGLPVLTVAHPAYGFSARPLDLTVLADGTVATVDEMQVALCFDAHCTDVGLATMPCYDGGLPQPMGDGARSCGIEAPLEAADISPAGTLLALTRDRGNIARFFWCRIERDAPDGQCLWGGAVSLHQQPEMWENWSTDIAALPDGGFAAVLLGAGSDQTSGTVLLATCASLDCPAPTLHRVLDVSLPDGWQGGGTVSVAADPRTGDLALGYFDRTDGSLWLGGCPAGCADGPQLNRVGSWPEYGAGTPVSILPSVQLVATATGPVAVLGTNVLDQGLEFGAPRTAAVIACDDLACAASEPVAWDRALVTATLVTDDAGNVVVVGSDTTGTQTLFGRFADGELVASSLLVGDVVAAAFGPDDRLRLVLDDDQGLALVTLGR